MSWTFSKLDDGMTSLPSQWQLKMCKWSCHLWLVIALHQDLWNSFTACTAFRDSRQKRDSQQINMKSTGCLRVLLMLQCSLAWGCFVVVLLVGVSSFQVLGGFGSASAFGEGEGCAEWVPAGGDRLTCQNVSVFEIKSLSFPPSGVFAQGLLTGI